MTKPRKVHDPTEVTCKNEIKRGNDDELPLGTSGARDRPRAQPKVTSMNEIRIGNDPKLHMGMTGPTHPEKPRDKPK
eukprot:8909282-Karenia_brevis.AAC.1